MWYLKFAKYFNIALHFSFLQCLMLLTCTQKKLSVVLSVVLLAPHNTILIQTNPNNHFIQIQNVHFITMAPIALFYPHCVIWIPRNCLPSHLLPVNCKPCHFLSPFYRNYKRLYWSRSYKTIFFSYSQIF